MQKSQSTKRMQLYSQNGKRRSSLEEFQPNATSTSGQNAFDFPSSTKQKFQPKNGHTIPLSELVNIKERTLLNHYPDALKRQQDKEMLKDKSAKRVQKWPNTLQAIRKKRDQWRFEKFEKEEQQRRLIDEEERKYQELVKKQILDKANKQIYLDQDRIRSFKSKMLLSDALQEREIQIEQKEQLRQIDRWRNEMYEEQMKEIIRQEQEEDARKQAEIQEKKRQTAKILKSQHDEMKTNYIRKLQEEKIEGEITKLHTIDAIEKEKQAEMARTNKQKQLNIEVSKGNDVLKEFKKKELLKEKLEEEKIKQYAKQKDQMEEMKRIRQKQSFQEKQNALSKLQETQYRKLQELKKDENLRINKQIVEAEIKAENVEKQKQEYKTGLINRIDKSIKQAQQRKQQEQKDLEEEDQKYKEFWVEKNKEIARREKQEKLEAFQRNRDLQNYHQSQINQKQKGREQDFMVEITEQEKILQLQEQGDQNFDFWSKRVLEQWKDDGKQTFPLLKELDNDKKKRVM